MATEIPLPFFPAEAQEENHEPLTFDILHSTGAGADCSNSFAGGVALSSTRVIYDGSRKEASLTVNNKSTTDEFLIQSWIDDANGNKRRPLSSLHRYLN